MKISQIRDSKRDELERRMMALEISEADLEERFVCGSGNGGQKVNKTSSCIVLRHISSGTVVKCQKTRSQASNRYFARKELCERLEEIKLGKESKRQKEIAKLRHQKQRRSRRAKAKMLAEKKNVGASKVLRKNITRSYHED